MTSKSKLASNPQYSATVKASAGSGKTWTLVSRMLRLLLQGNEPGSLLAITFTVKAAAEMKQRLLERLELWSYCDDEKLEGYLSEIDHPVSQQSKQQARLLFEQQLHAKTPTRTLTFHAFFQELLSQFPHAADIPSGFELIESTFDHEELAWQELITEAHHNQESELAKNILVLLEQLGTSQTRTAIKNFVKQRSDWWAWTEEHQDKNARLAFAIEELEQRLAPDLNTNHYAEIFNDILIKKLEVFATFFIQEDHTKTNRTIAENALDFLRSHKTQNNRTNFSELEGLLKTADGKKFRKISANKAIIKKYGESYDLALESHAQICTAISNCLEQINRCNNFLLNQAWYTVGQHYLDLFQQQKLQRRQLDFSDLEWKACQLMNSDDEFSQLMSMLDDKIEHLLVDEFQDTNPTQWRFLLPIINNFSASIERRNNLFIVGDSKQSIYGFRRANPKLLDEAGDYVKSQLGGEIFEENKSWRSAPQILNAVNRIFSAEGYGSDIGNYDEHTTNKDKLWGRVEIWPEFSKPANKQKPDELILRNPLLTPREATHNAFQDESKAIAAYIEQLIDDGLEITTDEDKRALRYADIKILVRNRTHVGDIERELQALAIPFKGSTRGTFMDRLEVKDLCATLKVLATPSDNLALAHVLRSPLFSITTTDLLALEAAQGDNWYQKLQSLAESDIDSQHFSNALTLLEQWQQLAAKLPLHDLITAIYFQGNVVERYLAAFPKWQSAQLEANLQRFVELALETNSGRYPGIHHFLAQLELQASASGDDSISEPTPGAARDCVEILTIHQAKGLESPVVFFANCNDRTQGRTSLNCIVDWPSDQTRPHLMVLLPGKDKLDNCLRELHEKQLKKERQEAANTLYVALTRAKQMLIISGSNPKQTAAQPSKITTSDSPKIPELSSIFKLFEDQVNDQGKVIIQSAKPTLIKTSQPETKITTPALAAELEDAISLRAHDIEIAPSRSDEQTTETTTGSNSDGRLRGNIIHYYLQQLSNDNTLNDLQLKTEAAAQHSIELSDQRLEDWLNESRKTIDEFSEFFTETKGFEYFSELPIIYQQGEKRVYGIIDRVIIEPEQITVLDYKTHQGSETELAKLADTFKKQLGYYKNGLTKMWPDKKIKCGLLYTHNNQICWISP